MAAPALIGVDWGSSSLRAFLIGADGVRLDHRSSDQGILNVADGGFADVLEATVGDWRRAAPGLPVLLSGMIGSRQGWAEAPYAACPVALTALANRFLALGDGVHIVPGLSTVGADGVHDVMRGEETQLVGAFSTTRGSDGLFCLPGTHAKWARIADEAITQFHTAMTGEVYAVLRSHSILRHGMAELGDRDAAAFDRGLARAHQPGGLLHHLFGVRAEGLFDTLGPAAAPSYLSGLLIGHELAGIRDLVGAVGRVTLIGQGELIKLYARALDVAGAHVDMLEGEAAAEAGLWRLARRAGLVEGEA